jgi:hypothetical protein
VVDNVRRVEVGSGVLGDGRVVKIVEADLKVGLQTPAADRRSM